MTDQSEALEGSTRRSVLRTSAVGVGALVAGAVAAGAETAQADTTTTASAARYFLTIREIPGSSTDKTYPGSIELIDASWGLTAGKGVDELFVTDSHPPTTFSAFHFTAPTDIDSPLLFMACAIGMRIREAELAIVQSPTAPANIKVIMQRVHVSAYSSRDTASLQQIDEVSLRFSTITYSYAPILASGTLGPEVIAVWNV